MLAPLLRSLFDDGCIAFQAVPVFPCPDRDEAAAVLAATFAIARLDVADPPIDFDPESAVACADFVIAASWYLVHRQVEPAEVERAMAKLPPPRSAGQHFSGDLTMRFAPQLYRRARAVSSNDVLTLRLAAELRAWPLSGVLSELDDPPSTALDFDGHDGLYLLYAERFTQRPREAWRPTGRGLEHLDLIHSHA